MTTTIDNAIKEFAKAFDKRIYDYARCFSVKITDLTLEELIVQTWRSIGFNPEWDAGGHSPGKDIGVATLNLGFSVKSGKENSKRLTISSFRTTTFKTLQEKLEYFDGAGKNYTHYLVLSRHEKKACKSRPVGSITYTARMIPADIVVASDKKWSVTPSGWASNTTDGVRLRIQKKMSDQFWFDIEKDTLDNHPDIIHLFSREINDNERGSYDWKRVV